MSTILVASRSNIHWMQVFLGGLIIAIGDTIFATTLWFSWDAPGFTKLFQTIAVGVLGQASYQGGVQAAWLGAGLHLFMASMFVLAYTLVSRRAPQLLRKPLAYGALYGVLLYAIMNFMVMPLSRVDAHPTLKHPDWLIYSVLVHMAFGMVCVLFARRALQRDG